MAQVAVVAKIPTLEGKRDELAAALQVALQTAEGEAGTEKYILHTDDGDANVLWMYEVYTDQDSMQAHMGSDAFKALGPAIGPFLAGRPELFFLKPIGGKGL